MLPLLLERAGVRRVKSSIYIPLIPAFSLWRRSSRTCADIDTIEVGLLMNFGNEPTFKRFVYNKQQKQSV